VKDYTLADWEGRLLRYSISIHWRRSICLFVEIGVFGGVPLQQIQFLVGRIPSEGGLVDLLEVVLLE
jgi:hypothetical protein